MGADLDDKPKTVKSVIRSVRIQEDIDKVLSDLSRQGRVSVNVLVNEGLRKFVEWDVYAKQFGVMTLPSAAAKKILNYMSDEEIKEFAKWVGQNLFKEYIMFWFKKISLQNVLKGVRLWGSVGNFQYEEELNGDVGTIICRHDMGPKWSLFYEETLRGAFEGLIGPKVKIETTEDQVLVQFPTSREVFLEDVLRHLQRSKG